MKKIIVTVLSLLVFAVSCKRDDDVYTIGAKNGQNPAGLFRITGMSAVQQEADTASLITINLLIAANADTASHTITMSTTLGTFSNGKTTGTLTAAANGTAQVYLRSGAVGIAHLTFTVQAITVDTAVTFVPALPSDLLLTADKYSGDTAGVFNVSAKLVRNTGKGVVTDPVKVLFSVIPATPGATLVFPAFAESAKGVAACAVNDPYNVKGTFTLEAWTPEEGGDTLRKYITLIIK